MAGILVYLPGCETADAKELITRGLGDLLDPIVDLIPTAVRNGPDGGDGCLVTFVGFGPADTPRTVDLATQEWREAPPNGELAKGRYWLGYVKAARPTPDELQRRELCDGELVTLKDGRQWVIPIGDYLPRRPTIDDTGIEVELVPERHKEYAEWCTEVFEGFLTNGFESRDAMGAELAIPRGFIGACLAIGKNYRVNRDVVDLLYLIERPEVFKIAAVAAGIMPGLRAIAEKKNLECSLLSASWR